MEKKLKDTVVMQHYNFIYQDLKNKMHTRATFCTILKNSVLKC